MKRAYSISDWQRDFARAFSAAVPLEAQSTRARGALFASSNDEPEPTFADIERDANEEARAIVADRAIEAAKDTDCRTLGRDRCDRLQAEEIQRMPGQGYLS